MKYLRPRSLSSNDNHNAFSKIYNFLINHFNQVTAETAVHISPTSSFNSSAESTKINNDASLTHDIDPFSEKKNVESKLIMNFSVKTDKFYLNQQLTTAQKTKFLRHVKDPITDEEFKESDVKLPHIYLTKPKTIINDTYSIKRVDIDTGDESNHTIIHTSPIAQLKNVQTIPTSPHKLSHGITEASTKRILSLYTDDELMQISKNIFLEKYLSMENLYIKSSTVLGDRTFEKQLSTEQKLELLISSKSLKEIHFNRKKILKGIDDFLLNLSDEILVSNLNTASMNLLNKYHTVLTNIDESVKINISAIDSEMVNAIKYFYKTNSDAIREQIVQNFVNEYYLLHKEKILIQLRRDMYNFESTFDNDKNFIQITKLNESKGLTMLSDTSVIDI